MASVSAVQTTTSSTPGTIGTSTLGKDDFLKLLIAQVSNQDPLSPMDNTAFVAQLAQFASVEQLQGANQRLDSLALGQANANQTAAANLVGKDVSYRSSSVVLQQGAAATPVGGLISSDASSVSVVISDASGRTVRTLNYGAAAAGTFKANWDGCDQAGTKLPAGTYNVSITAADSQGTPISVTTEGTGRVTGVSFADGTAQLVVGGAHVQLADVIEIDQPPTP